MVRYSCVPSPHSDKALKKACAVIGVLSHVTVKGIGWNHPVCMLALVLDEHFDMAEEPDVYA